MGARMITIEILDSPCNVVCEEEILIDDFRHVPDVRTVEMINYETLATEKWVAGWTGFRQLRLLAGRHYRESEEDWLSFVDTINAEIDKIRRDETVTKVTVWR